MKIGISKKVILLFILLVIILGTALGFYSHKHQKETMLMEFDERVKVLLSALAVSSEYPVLIGNKKALDKIGKGILDQNDVVSCEIRDSRGEILYKEGLKSGKNYREYTFPILTETDKELTGEELILGIKKKETKEIGKIYLVLSISALVKKLNKMEKTMAGLVISGIAFAFIFITILVRLILSKPIHDLIRGTERISRGDLKYKVPIKSNDEIGTLTNSFNNMAEDLSNILVSKDYVDNIINSMAESLVVTDAGGRIKTVNPATLDLSGYKEEEIIGQSISSLFEEEEREKEELSVGEDFPFEKNIFRDLVKNGIVSNFEMNYLTKGKKKIPVIFSGSTIKDREGKIVNIVWVARDITEHKEAEKKIKASLKEKEVLLKEIHHRVKNNMQIISSLLNLQSSYIKNKKVLDIFKISRDRIFSMALIHEKLYQSKDLARIDFGQYIQGLVVHLFRSYRIDPKTIALETDVKNSFLDINLAIPCGLIINELVSNSLKHAFVENRAGGERNESLDKIYVSLHSNGEGRFALVVQDNGVGFPKDLDFRKTKSLGLQLVNDLVNQIDGSIELQRGRGTAFKITFNALK